MVQVVTEAPHDAETLARICGDMHTGLTFKVSLPAFAVSFVPLHRSTCLSDHERWLQAFETSCDVDMSEDW